MCGRFSLTANLTTVAQRFGVRTPTAESAVWAPSYNIAPTKTVVIVGDDGTRYLAQMRWGRLRRNRWLGGRGRRRADGG